jgi:multicomponent Na+:H+ antiporter subunit E
VSLWAVLLAAAWWLWSAHTEMLIIIFGVFSIGLTLLFFARMDREAGEQLPYKLGLRPLFYLPYIFWEIVKANIDVAKIICSPKMKINPQMFRAKASQQTIIGQVIYANSITLTPGTITLDVRDGEFLVHALTKDAADGVLAGDMDRRVTKLEGRA